jgi:hypothetical protein
MFTKLKEWTGQAPVFSEDPAVRAVELAFLQRLSRFLGLDHDPGRVLDLATQGKLQEILPALDDENTPAQRVPYDSLKPFDYDAWSKTQPSFDEVAGFPGPGDRLFDSVQAAPSNPSDFDRGQAWYDYINGYKDAADALLKHADATNVRKLGYPIVFLYRQHLELSLKSLVRDCSDFLGESAPQTNHHDLGRLWTTCQGFIARISPGASDNDEMHHVTRLLNDFCDIDRRSDAFRFPEDKAGQLHPSADVDLQVMKDAIDKIALLLECIGEDLHARRGTEN